MEPLAEYAGGLPNLCLQEPRYQATGVARQHGFLRALDG